jgi:hypothetical protein
MESQARDGRSGVDDLPIIKLDEPCNETAFMDERKKLREKQGHGWPGRVDDQPIHTPAQPPNGTASRDASKSNGVGL